MTGKRFNSIVEEQLDKCRSLLVTKGAEYSLDADRLCAFKKAAALQGITPKQALCGMMAKHVISVYDMCFSKDTFTAERWNEKITDTMNYLILLKGMIEDEGPAE